MTTELTCVRDDSTISEALLTLADAHIHGVPVLDSRGRLVGVLSTSDVLEAASECSNTEERERLFGETLVREIMTTRPRTISPEHDVKRAAQEMLYLDVHRLFVEYDGELVGVISQSDIVGAVANAKL
ncbi:MAG: HPP family protein [Gemmatimonadales bacterium]